MLQLILMLLGLAFPNSNNNVQTVKDNHHVEVATPSNADGDTGGETPVPPKK